MKVKHKPFNLMISFGDSDSEIKSYVAKSIESKTADVDQLFEFLKVFFLYLYFSKHTTYFFEISSTKK